MHHAPANMIWLGGSTDVAAITTGSLNRMSKCAATWEEPATIGGGQYEEFCAQYLGSVDSVQQLLLAATDVDVGQLRATGH